MMKPVNLSTALATFDEPWRPRIIGQFQNAKVQLAKFEGDFVWHQHDDSDDFFLVLDGTMLLDLPDQTLELSAGDLFIVPAGTQHRPRAIGQVHVLNLEIAGTVNTGDAASPGALRAPEQDLHAP
jgi:mannose-6-phosphate isomerase-like protein (cupin superfamily)